MRERGVSTRGSGEGAARCRRACGDRLGAQGVRGEAAQVRREERVHLVGCRDGAHGRYVGDEAEVVVVVERGREGIMGRELWGWYIYAQSPRTSHGPASLSRSRSRSIALVPSLALGYSGFSATPHSSPPRLLTDGPHTLRWEILRCSSAYCRCATQAGSMSVRSRGKASRNLDSIRKGCLTGSNWRYATAWPSVLGQRSYARTGQTRERCTACSQGQTSATHP